MSFIYTVIRRRFERKPFNFTNYFICKQHEGKQQWISGNGVYQILDKQVARICSGCLMRNFETIISRHKDASEICHEKRKSPEP